MRLNLVETKESEKRSVGIVGLPQRLYWFDVEFRSYLLALNLQPAIDCAVPATVNVESSAATTISFFIRPLFLGKERSR